MLKELDVGFIFLAPSFENLLYHHYEVYNDITFCGYKLQTEKSVSLKELLIPVFEFDVYRSKPLLQLTFEVWYLGIWEPLLSNTKTA